MAMKFNIFTNDNKDANNTANENIVKDNPIISMELMGYILKEFPEVAENIKGSLVTLRDTLENSIDIIEDKSSDIVKGKRDFQLSGKYREASMQLHDIAVNIENYMNWMAKDDKAIDSEEDKTENKIENVEESLEESKEECVEVLNDNNEKF